MNHINAYQQKTSELLAQVNDISRELTDSIGKINSLNEHLGRFYELFRRGSESSRILQEYFQSLDRDITELKAAYHKYRDSLTQIKQFVNQANNLLRSLSISIDQIEAMSGLFIKSARLLGNLAKNTEIKAHEAQDEGKGLAVIAQEALKLARLAQHPLKDLSDRLGDLRSIAQPAIEELGPIVELARSAPELINNCITILATIDNSASTIKQMIGRTQRTNQMIARLGDVINEGISKMTAQLSANLSSIDNMSLRGSQIRKLSEELAHADQMIGLIDAASGGNAEEREYLACKKNFFAGDFAFIRQENMRLLASFQIDEEPPVLSPEIHDNISNIAAQTGELKTIAAELVSSRQELGTRIESVVDLSSRISGFIEETAGIRGRLINVGKTLAGELSLIEDQIGTTHRIFNRMKTLGLFVRIEESRSSFYRAVISPVVEKFFGLQFDIEEAINGITPEVEQLHAIIDFFKNTRVVFPASKIPSPDYSRLKIFLDDIHRVFIEAIEQSASISEIARSIAAEKKSLHKEWNDLLSILSQLQQMHGLISDRPFVSPAAEIMIKPDIVKINIANDPITLRPDVKTDMTSSQIINCFSSGLFEFSRGVEVLPALCKTYSISPDGMQYDLVMRPDVKFQNGRPISAEDMKLGVIRALSGPNFNLFEMIEGGEEFIQTKNTKNLGVEALNRSTLRIKLAYPFLPLISNFATNVADPFIDQELPVCAGPYQLVAFDRGRRIILRANQFYYRGKPPVDEIDFIIEDDEEKCYESFRRGDLDVYRLSSLTHDRLLKESPGSVQTTPELSIQYLCINCQKVPFDQQLVRQAICHAIDVEGMIISLLKDEAVRANGIFPPSMPAHNRELAGYRYDPDRARALLNAAGFPGGLPGTYQIDVSGNVPARQRAEFVKEHLARIGIKTEINPLPFSRLIEKNNEGRSILSFRGWISDNGDPDNFVFPLFHSSSYGRTGNTFFFSTPELDKDIDNARRIHNLMQRTMLYQKIEANILEEAPAVFLYHRLVTLAINEKIRGFSPHPLNLFNLKSAWADWRTPARAPVLSGA